MPPAHRGEHLDGQCCVAGHTASTDFPLQNPLQATYSGGSRDCFVTKVNSSGSALTFSTYVGGVSQEQAIAATIDSSGATYVTGWTQSTDFPTQSAIQPTFGRRRRCWRKPRP